MDDPIIWDKEKITIGQSMVHAIENSDAKLAEDILTENPWLVSDYTYTGRVTWVSIAARRSSVEVMRVLHKKGFNLDALRLHENSTALVSAIDVQNDEIVEFLLENNANVQLSRPMIAALHYEVPFERSVRYIKLLLKHGVDINRTYEIYGDAENLMTALDLVSNDKIKDFLIENGAKTAAELKSRKKSI